jgi:hypothetical protein
MSQRGPPDKRRKVDEDSADDSADDADAFDERLERPSHYTVIVSNAGDTRPEESVPDAVSNFLLNQGTSVTNYVVVPEVGVEPLFLANFRDVYDTKADGTEHKRKGQLRSRYVKKMTPSTAFLKDIACDVMILFCHGSDCPGRPHYMCFSEEHGVSLDGHVLQDTPPATTIWACSSCDNNKKPDQGVTLSEVVRASKLVLLLSCCAKPIVQQYASEAVNKSDFVVFSMESAIQDISHNIFLALLMNAIELCPDYMRHGHWDEFVKRNVCQVLLWIKGNSGSVEAFWTFLQDADIITTGQNRAIEIEDEFRVKGCINTYKAYVVSVDGVQVDEKQIFLNDLMSLTLMIWNGKCYSEIDHWNEEGDLVAWKDGIKDFAQPVRKAAAAKQVCSAQVAMLLAQLKGLAHI